MNRTAVHASNVPHWHHVVEAQAKSHDAVRLLRRLEFEPATLRRASTVLPRRVVDVMRRRVASESVPTTATIRSLGPTQYLYPTMARLGMRPGREATLTVHRAMGRRVARATSESSLLHFIEGLGVETLARPRSAPTIMERRNFHHAVFETPIKAFLDFPGGPALDPLSDRLEIEYARADTIIVYSEAVKTSFVERGHPPDKIAVIPLPYDAKAPEIRAPREENLAVYVGRSDIYKGLDLAVATVHAAGAPWRLEVAGPMKSDVLTWLRGFDFVTYRGILGKADIAMLNARATVSLMPSIESFGLAAGESVAGGAHLICRETTGIGEYLPESALTIVQGRDLDAWVAALTDAKPREHVSTDSIELPTTRAAVVARLVDLYERSWAYW